MQQPFVKMENAFEKQTVLISAITFASRKHTYVYSFDPLKPHFYIVKLGFTGVYIIFLISAQKHVLSFLSENFQFLEVKFSIYLNRCVFVMDALVSLRRDVFSSFIAW